MTKQHDLAELGLALNGSIEVEYELEPIVEPTWDYRNGCVGADRVLDYDCTPIEINGKCAQDYPRILAALSRLDIELEDDNDYHPWE